MPHSAIETALDHRSVARSLRAFHRGQSVIPQLSACFVRIRGRLLRNLALLRPAGHMGSPGAALLAIKTTGAP